MAMAMRASRRSYGVASRPSYRPMSEINVTPMVDVMLVLLVIFMVTAPLLTVGVQVNLPKTKAAVIPGHDEPLVISITADAKIFIQETEVELENLVPRLKAITLNRPNTRIFVRGDRNVVYGAIMGVMGTVSVAGFTKVALIAELPEVASKSRRSKKRKK